MSCLWFFLRFFAALARPSTVKYEDFEDAAKTDQFGKAPIQNEDAFLHGVVCKAKVTTCAC